MKRNTKPKTTNTPAHALFQSLFGDLPKTMGKCECGGTICRVQSVAPDRIVSKLECNKCHKAGA